MFCLISIVFALPSGPEVTFYSNSSANPANAATVNTSGGSITTMVLNSSTQNSRWKAYVGNVTGTLSLDDASDYSIFDWSVTNPLGEVYATRSSGTVDWANINCSTLQNITNEEVAINHTTNPNDNISITFNSQQHGSFYVGSVSIAANDCYSIHTHVNDTAQSSDFEEMLLHDEENMIYTTTIESNVPGYRPNETYDFQMILPEIGVPGWTSSTAYYFYVELT